MRELLLGHRYRTIEKIGTGGMADVFRASDETLGRTVAVKVMHARFASDPEFTARFRQEAQAVANLSSPHIVNMYDWGQDSGTYYIVMELLRGTDLKALERGRPLSSAKVAEIGAQVCAALSVAHGYGVIHRDIKPHNIMVQPDGTVKVMDFGVAHAGNTALTQAGSVLGTSQYISPEQALGETLTPASDLYSLGVVLYEAATGRLPFESDTPVATALMQVSAVAVAPSTVNPDVDPALEAVILKAMSKKAIDRYGSADQMLRELTDVAEHRPRIDDARTTVLPVTSKTAVMPVVVAAHLPMPDPNVPDRDRETRREIGTEAPAGQSGHPLPKWVWVLAAALLVALGFAVASGAPLLGGVGGKPASSETTATVRDTLGAVGDQLKTAPVTATAPVAPALVDTAALEPTAAALESGSKPGKSKGRHK